MSLKTEESEEELSIPEEEEEEEKIDIGLYIGGRNSQGERDGKGWAILPNGDQYDGQYKRGKRHGFGLYVFPNGARYYGQYRCGHRSGRGIFIYPDGSYYEGCWRKNLKHGKGRYCYANGDCYCGSWYHGLRHGIGIYTMNNASSGPSCGVANFKGTWRQGVRVGPFQLSFGHEYKCTTLHGTWDNKYPQGPAVFSFDERLLLMGYFQSASRAKSSALEETVDEENSRETLDLWSNGEPSMWYAQKMCRYDYALLPQEPVPLPVSDSDISVCSLTRTTSELTMVKEPICAVEGEEEATALLECLECECENSISEVASSTEICVPARGDQCAIEISNQI
ncbi:radial spoke head 1 homolog [Stomoxys calcitrans]|uniref:radial spoke head 1 homolog n=1 Tax=Stomoxys calcitrans TaxID=35570 RepID=UPI0027E2DA60|nr:radial spoke head 1 homolog [Stomoxys calcitrans]